MREGACRVVSGTQMPERGPGRAETVTTGLPAACGGSAIRQPLEGHKVLFCLLNVSSPRYLSKHPEQPLPIHQRLMGACLGTSAESAKRHGHQAHPLSRTTAHPSAGDCRPSSWSLRTARHGRRPRLGAGTAPKWGRFQPPPFPASRPPVLKQHNKTGVRTSARE